MNILVNLLFSFCFFFVNDFVVFIFPGTQESRTPAQGDGAPGGSVNLGNAVKGSAGVGARVAWVCMGCIDKN